MRVHVPQARNEVLAPAIHNSGTIHSPWLRRGDAHYLLVANGHVLVWQNGTLGNLPDIHPRDGQILVFTVT